MAVEINSRKVVQVKTCKRCHKDFGITRKWKKFLKSQRWKDPSRCPECLKLRLETKRQNKLIKNMG